MLGRVTSTPSGTRGSCFLIIMLPGGQTLAGDAATVCNSHAIATGRYLPANPANFLAPLSGHPCRGRGPAGQRHFLPGVRVPWGVDDDARLGHVQHREL